MPRGRPSNVHGVHRGVSFGEDGPSIGPVALLRRTDGVLTVRPIEELQYVLRHAMEGSFSIEPYVRALDGVARAMNAGDIGQAMLRVQLMNLPALPNERAFERALDAEELAKGIFDPLKHPRVPKGTPQGGQFRAIGEAAVRAAEALSRAELRIVANRRLVGAVVRSSARLAMRKLLSEQAKRRLALVVGEIPGIGEILDAEQMAEVAEDLGDVPESFEKAAEFVAEGPHTLEDISVSKVPRNFKNYDQLRKDTPLDEVDLEKVLGPAKPGFHYHHIVEQGSGFSEAELNSTENVVQIPEMLHNEVSAEYQSVRLHGGVRQSLRSYLRGKSFEVHRAEGLRVLQELGIIKGAPK